MAKLSKSERLKRYRSRLNHARRWREEEGFDATWKRMVDLYKGKHFPAGMDDEDRIAINMAFSTINVMFPALTVNYPKIEVLANKEEFSNQAVIAEAILNYWWRHYDFRRPFRDATKDSLVIGHGWIKVGYKFEEQDAYLDDDERMSAREELNAQADAYAMANPEMANELPTEDEIAANAPSTKTVIVEDRPTVERVSPFDMFVDPEATCMDDAKWVAQRIVRPLAEVKADKRYNYGVRKNLKADAVVSSEWMGRDERKKLQSDLDRVTIWEYYDIASETMCVFAEGGDDYLIDPVEMPFAFGHPYEYIPNYEVPDQFYSIGDLEMIEAPQQELNKTRSQMMNHRKKYGRKYMYRASALGPEGREGLESNEDNIAIEIIDDNIPLQDVIVPVPITPMAGDLYQYSDLIEADMDKVSGVNEYARGASPEIRRTATEAAMIQDGANARSADKLARIELSIASIARKVLMLAQQFMTAPQSARIVGGNGDSFWFTYDHEDIEGEFDFQVEAGSTQPQNDTFRRQQAIAMMNSMGPLIGTVIDPAAMAKYVLQFGFGIKSPAKFMLEQPMMPMGPADPMALGAAPNGEGMDAPQMNPQDLQAAKDAGGMDMAGLAPAQTGIPPQLLAQLDGQMGIGVQPRA